MKIEIVDPVTIKIINICSTTGQESVKYLNIIDDVTQLMFINNKNGLHLTIDLRLDERTPTFILFFYKNISRIYYFLALYNK